MTAIFAILRQVLISLLKDETFNGSIKSCCTLLPGLFLAVCFLRLLPTGEWCCTVEQEYSGLEKVLRVEAAKGCGYIYFVLKVPGLYRQHKEQTHKLKKRALHF